MEFESLKEVSLIPKAASGAAAWKEWHIALKRRFGKKSANMIFVKAWEKRGGTASPAMTSDLRDYMKTQDVDLDTTVVQDIMDTGSDISNFFGDIIKTSAYMGMAISGIVVVGLAMLIFNIAKQPLEAAKVALQFTPQGAASSSISKMKG